MLSFSAILFILVSLEIYHCVPIEEIQDALNWDMTVHTSDGKVKGHLINSHMENITYYSFQSIPYAEPPVGGLRFRPAKPISPWSGTLDATKSPKACPQPSLPEDEMSEDCLVLNVFIPSSRPKRLLPVILWIHGGYFQIGHGGMTNYPPDLLINEEVIFVSINYRLGVLGFLSAGDTVLPGNNGIKDQILAMKWVHKNIENFGGNPYKITLMGQSAGGAEIGILLQTPLTEGLFSAAILESGNSLNLWSRSPTPKTTTEKIAKYFKIQYSTTEELIEELQKIEWTDLILGSSEVFILDTAFSNPANGLTIGPVVEPHEDGVLTGHVHEKLQTGRFHRVPILTGFTSAEGNVLAPAFDSMKTFLKLYDMFPSKLAPNDLNVDSSELTAIGKKVKEFYFGSNSVTASKEVFANFVTEHEFIQPANEFVRLVSKYVRTYFYRFAYVGELAVIEDEVRELPGAVHCEELQYLFCSPLENPPSDADLVTRKRLVKLWTNFAKYHNPTPDVDPLFQDILWKPVHPTQINYLDIDTELRMRENPNKEQMAFWASIYKKYGLPPFDTY